MPLKMSSFFPNSSWITLTAADTTLGCGLKKHFLIFSAYKGMELGHNYSILYKHINAFWTIFGFVCSNSFDKGSINPGADPEYINLGIALREDMTTKSTSLSKSLPIDAANKILNWEFSSSKRQLAK